VNSRVVTLVLLVGLCGAALMLVPRMAALRMPGNQQDYEPPQPIEFSHRLHAGELQVSCLYCHSGAEKSRHAGIPAASACMNCHQSVTAPFGAIRAEEEQAKKEGRKVRPIVSPEIQKLYDALALNEKRERDPQKQPRPIAWTKIHSVPDYVYFDHRAHVNKGISCQQCHGPVETMDRVRQQADLTMGWCVNCHRQNSPGFNGAGKVNPLADCATCHY